MKTELITILRSAGERLPKKHGWWYLLHAYDNHWLVYDTWSETIYHYPNGAKPSDTDNMYGVVYVFWDNNGRADNCKRVKPNMFPFWYGHVCHKPFKPY